MDADTGQGVRRYSHDRGSGLGFHGRMDIFLAEEVQAATKALLEAEGDVEVDCSQAEHVDTAILQLLVALKQGLEPRGRRLHLTGVEDRMREMLLLTGLDQLLPCRETNGIQALPAETSSALEEL